MVTWSTKSGLCRRYSCHGERSSLQTHARNFRLMEVLDKGKAAAVTTIVETRDKLSGKLIFENQSTFFVRGAGGFGGKRVGRGMIHPVMFMILRVEGRVGF